jgi:hypothetical protein
MAEGGHMIVPSIGQCMFSSISIAIWRADAISGDTHIVPTT